MMRQTVLKIIMDQTINISGLMGLNPVGANLFKNGAQTRKSKSKVRVEENISIEALQSGDARAYEQLVTVFQERVIHTCLGFVKNTEEAEDLAQEVFVEVFRSISRFRGASSLSTWIYRIAVNKSLERIRWYQQKKRASQWKGLLGGNKEAESVPDHSFNHPGFQLENREKAEVLFGAIDQLPENQRIAFTLAKVEGYSYQETSDIMGVSIPSVESLLFRARKNLQKKLYNFYKKES